MNTPARKCVGMALSPAALLFVDQLAFARPTSGKSDENAQKHATLINQLGDDALIYLRLGNPFDGLRAPGKALEPVLASKAHEEVLSELRSNVSELIAPFGSTQARGLNAIVDGLDGPVELALAAPGGVFTPAASLMLRIPLKTTEKQLVAAINATIAPKYKAIAFDAQGLASIALEGNQAVALHFDRAVQSLTINVQMGSSKLASKYLQTGALSESTTARTINALDPTSRQFALWINIKAMAPYLSIAAQGAEPEQAALIGALAEVESLSASVRTGARGGSELVFALDGFSDALLSYIPAGSNRLDVPVLGTPRSLVSLQLPSAAQARRMLEQLMNTSGPAHWQKYQSWIKENKFDPLALFELVGPSVQLVNDQNGGFYALQLNSAQGFERYLSELRRVLQKEKFQLNLRKVPARGQTYTWLSVKAPSTSTVPEPKDALERAARRVALEFANAGTSLGVYRTEGNWLLLGSVPQTLYGRTGRTDELPRWLEQDQRQDLGRAVLAYSAPVNEQTTTTYETYLSVLSQIGLLINRPIAIEKMPAPNEITMPTQGAIGFSIDRLPRGLEFKLHYKDSAMEFVGGQSVFGMVAVTGILGAIAVPAYQDYVYRARVAGDLARLSGAKLQLAETLMTEGRLPEGFTPHVDEQPSYISKIEMLEQSIVLTYGETDRPLAGKTLALTPCFNSDPRASPVEIVGWACGYAQCSTGTAGSEQNYTTVPPKYLPAMCR